MMQHSQAFNWHSRYSVINYIAKMYTKNVCNIYSGCYGVCLKVIQLFFEISTFNLTHKVPLNTSFEIRKSGKIMPSLAYSEIDHTNYPVSSKFAFVYICGHIYMYFNVNNLAGQFKPKQKRLPIR